MKIQARTLHCAVHIGILWIISVTALVLGAYSTSKNSNVHTQNYRTDTTALQAGLDLLIVKDCMSTTVSKEDVLKKCIKPFDRRPSTCFNSPKYVWAAEISKNNKIVTHSDIQHINYMHPFFNETVTEEENFEAIVRAFELFEKRDRLPFVDSGTYFWPPTTDIKKYAIWLWISSDNRGGEKDLIIATGIELIAACL